MSRIIYDREMIKVIDLLEALIKVPIKDCFREGDTFYCIVAQGFIGKAIGKKGNTIRRINQFFKKKIKFIEYGETPRKLVSNLVYPLKIKEIREEGKTILIVGGNKKIRAALIGREGKNLKFLNKAIRRFFDVEIKVV